MKISRRRKLLYAGGLMVALLVVCEAGLRLRAWMRYGTTSSAVRDPMLTYDAASDLQVLIPGYEMKGAKLNIKINSLGFRGDEIARQKPPGTFRIVCLGASTTFSASASSNDAIWTKRLQVKLQEAHPGMRIEVVNAAVDGYVADDNLKNLARVLPLEPDLVIYYEANNEIVKDTKAIAIRDGLIAEDGGNRPGWIAAIAKASLLVDLVHKNLTILARSRDNDSPRLDRVPPELPDRFIGVLDQIRSRLAERGIPMVLSTFIVKYRRDQDRPTQIANADVAFYYMPWMSIDGMLDAVDVYNGAILAYAKRTGLPVVDDRTTIPADATHFIDCMHLADAGNEAMAQRFFRFIQAAGLVRSRP